MNTPTLRSPSLKMAALGMLVLLLLVPLAYVYDLIGERRARAQEAESSIAGQWGQAQTLATPWLLAHFPSTTRLADGSFVLDRKWRVLLADEVDVATTLVPEMRYRGMFEVPVYTAKTTLRAHFSREDMAEFMAGADEQTAVALRIGMSDARGLRALDRWEVDGKPMQPAAATRELADLASIGHALPAATTQRDFTVDIALTVAGVRDLAVLPFARTTRATARSTWRNPSFEGAYLPAERDIRDDGFDARWQVLELNRDYGQSFVLGEVPAHALLGSAFGVELYTPADVYQQNERSGKYGILMIALVFVALFLFENIARVTLHPVQYLLIGLALALFYLLLLALSEHLGFAIAYLIAAVAAIALVAGYARAVLSSWRRAAAVALLQGAAYGVFFVLVRSEDVALLLGSLTLFAALALVMYLTRRMDWSAVASGRSPQPSGATIG